MKKTEEDPRKRIAQFLPQAINKVTESYEQFLEQMKAQSEKKPDEENFDPKKFKEAHDACKMAIAHVELLLKLARWSETPNAAQSEQELADEIARAREEAAHEEN